MQWIVLPSPRQLLAAATLVLLGVTSAGAQATGRVRGRVVETGTNRAISDAQVIVQGGTIGGVTNEAGDYTISNVPAGARTIEVRRLGYGRRSQAVVVPAGGEVRADFELSPAASQLDAVVVTGTAGAVEKRTVGNAITQINVADVTDRTTVSNVTDVLQARSPGVQIAAGSGTPGTASDITIRGTSSFTATRPVVYIDGVRMSTASVGNFDPSGQGLAANSGGQTTSALDLVNPEDIESIEVIKGPAASTLYGADAAGGVIQIITKKGTRGQQGVSWTARAELGQNDLGSVELPINYTTCDAAKLAAPATWPGCVGKAAGTVLSESPIRDVPGAIRDGAVRRYSLAARGGGDRFSYYISGDHDYEEGVLANNYNRRNSIRSNFAFTPSEKADFQINFGVFDARLRLPLGDESAQGILFASQRGRPGRVSGLQGQAQEGFLTVTPATSNMYDNETSTDRITFGTTFNYQPFSWFRNRLTLGLDWTNGLATLFAPPNTPDLTGDTLGLTAQRIPRNTLYTLDYSGSVDHNFGSSLLSTTSIGSQVIASRNQVLSANGRGLGSPDVTLIGSTSQVTAANSFSENNSVGYYVQEQLGWNNRLFVTGAVRADDNSSFGTDFDIITYPKASISYIVSEEPALRRYFDAVHADNLKLRAAWGEAGKAPAPYSATRTYTISTVTIGSGSASALRTGDYGNPGLKPERGVETEVGFDAEFFHGRLGGELTYYNKKMNDVLFSQSIAPSTGFRGGQQQNIGSTKNSGLELGITATPLRFRNFVWDSHVSLATNHNELVSFGDTSQKFVVLSGASYGSVQRNVPGYPIAGYWAGIPRRNPDGTPMFNGTRPVLDTMYIGPSLPTREVAFANTITLFKNLSLYGLLDYKAGHYNYRGAELYRCGSAQNCIELNDPNFPASEAALYRIGAGSNAPYGIYIYKADFVKLRDLSATLLLPPKYASLAKVRTASLTLAGHNLAIWSDYPGPDPEVSTYGSRDVTRAFLRGDIYSMPMTRRISLSLNLTF